MKGVPPMQSGPPTLDPFDAIRVWPGALPAAGANVAGHAAPHGPVAPVVPTAPPEDLALVARLRRGEEAAFVALLDRHHGALLRLARIWVADPATAEEVVQETWLAVLRGIDGFRGHASLKTWIVGILANQAKRRAVRGPERLPRADRGDPRERSVPFSALARAPGDDGAPAVDPDRFVPAGDAGAGRWAAPPQPWRNAPEARLLAVEARTRIGAAIDALPPNHRTVILLRDVAGLNAAEACNVLGISATNQRVLLHRARSRVRAALESYLREGDAPGHGPRTDLPGVR